MDKIRYNHRAKALNRAMGLSIKAIAEVEKELINRPWYDLDGLTRQEIRLIAYRVTQAISRVEEVMESCNNSWDPTEYIKVADGQGGSELFSLRKDYSPSELLRVLDFVTKAFLESSLMTPEEQEVYISSSDCKSKRAEIIEKIIERNAGLKMLGLRLAQAHIEAQHKERKNKV